MLSTLFLLTIQGNLHFDLVMMTFRVRLKKARKPNQPRLRFDLKKLRDPDVACTFQATIAGKFAPLIGLSDEDLYIDTMITTYNTAVTDAASEIRGKEGRKSHGSPKIFSASVMRGEIRRRNGVTQKEQKNTGKQTEGIRRQ